MFVEVHAALRDAQRFTKRGLREIEAISDSSDSVHDLNTSAPSRKRQQGRYLPPVALVGNLAAMSEAVHRRGKVTDLHREEARLLRELWSASAENRQARGERSQEAFGEAYDIGNQAAVGFFLNGKTALSLKAARGFARGLRCRVVDFSPRLAKLLESPTPAVEPMSLNEDEAQHIQHLRALSPVEQVRVLRLAELLYLAAGIEGAVLEQSPLPATSEPAPVR